MVNFAVSAQTAMEGAGTLTAKVTLSAVQPASVSVTFTRVGTATPGLDFTPPLSPLVIPANSLEAVLSIPIAPDTLPEPTETIQFTLTGAVGASLGTSLVHKITLMDDDGPYTYSRLGDVVPALTMSPAALQFPATQVGAQSASQAVTVTNPSGQPLRLDGFLLEGTDPGEFIAQTGSQLPILIPPLSTATLQVSMTPNAQGALAASMALRQTPHPHRPSSLKLGGVAYGPTGAEVLTNCGGSGYEAQNGAIFAADYGFGGLSSIVNAAPPGNIAATIDDALYANARTGSAFLYNFTLPNGGYRVKLRLAELDPSSYIGKRVFSVNSEGLAVVVDLDLTADAGVLTAHDVEFESTVADGALTLQFLASQGKALVNAIEVRSMAKLTAAPSSVSLLDALVGQTLSKPVTLSNLGLHPAKLTSLDIAHATGDSHDFYVDIGGQILSGSATNVSHPLNLTVAPGASLVATLVFQPDTHSVNQFSLTFAGDFVPSQIVSVSTSAGLGGDPYLHPVILVDETHVDYDANGVEDVLLDGSDSHTHEPLKSLTEWIWEENGQVLATQEIATVTLPVGAHDVKLTIKDDNTPKHQLSALDVFEVVAVDQVPGVLTAYYNAMGTGLTPIELLDLVPANADFAEVRAQLAVETGPAGTIGGSPFTANVMASAHAAFGVAQPDTYDFQALGGAATRVFVDGTLFTTPRFLAAGTHAIEVRWALEAMAQLPAKLEFSVGGGAFAPLPPESLVHDPRLVAPIIHSMPSVGSTVGGYQLVIDGFGFFPKNQITVHWGTTALTAAGFTKWSAKQIEFTVPAGTGVISVTVQSPQGTSKPRVFVYDPGGPPPILFSLGPVHGADQPTCAAWAPDGRLFVGQRTGHIKAFTFHPDYSLASSVTYPGVSALSNKEILGLAFSPYEAAGPLKLYVSHSSMYAQGGSSFSGPAPYPGRISVLTQPGFDSPVALVTGLPTSNHDHSVNGMEFDSNGDMLVPVGSNTNAGVKFPPMGDLPESPLSAAILRVELSNPAFDGAVQHVLTATGQPTNDQVFGEVSDVLPGSHVSVHASGLRNAYDLVLTTWGELFAADNGPNYGFGPASTGPNTDTGAGQPNEPDKLLRIEYAHYYGHANRARGRYVPSENVWHPYWQASSWDYTAALSPLPSSSNGIVEYRSTCFASQMRGNLLIQKWNDQALRVNLTGDKQSVISVTDLAPLTRSLDLLTGPGGALVGIDYTNNSVRIFLPQDVGATGLVATEITPWRAPLSGGTPFVIGGMNFGSALDTSVQVGGVPATVTSVTPTRIHGTIPAVAAPPSGLLDVVVSVGSLQTTIPAAFQYLPATPGLWPGSWSSLPNMPVQIGEVACGVIEGRLYLVGESSNKTLMRDPVTGVWVDNLAVRPFVGHHHAAEVHAGKWYLLGGLDSGQGKVQIYDPATNTWSLGADMPWAGGSVASCLINGKIYVSGGIVGNVTVDDCAVYDIATNTWTALAPMPPSKGRNHAASGTDGSKFWIFGGRGAGSGPGNFVANGFADVQVYDPQSNTWSASFDVGSSIPPMPNGRGGTGKAVFFKNAFYVFGGETFDGAGAVAGNVFDRVDVYNPTLQTWRLDKPMPTPRHGIFPVVVQGKIYVAGGGTVAGFSKSSVVEAFAK